MVSDLYLDTESSVADHLLERLRVATAGTYDIAGVLGRGGMAVVFVGEDMRLRRTVAIKVMEPHLGALPGMAERFLEEARTLAHLQHPNIIVVHDVQQAKGLSFFVMALIEGGGVDQLCRREEPFPIDQARWILLQASSALAYAHSERIIHRDVKPANILVNVKGEAVLTDFGIAKVSDGGGLTKSGTQIGTPVYMSPEQFSEAPIGPASDQYALGVTAYEMLTGKPPFTGDLYAIIAAHGVKAPVPIRQVRPDCPAYLANAVMRMLEKRPEDRWPSLDDLREVFGANMPSDGGAARRQLATIARDLHRERKEFVKALSAEAPQSPVPTNASRPSARARPRNHSVTVWPPAATIYVGGTLDLRASVTTDAGDTLADAVIVWSSSHPEVVDVGATGNLRGVAHGTAVIRATVDGISAEATITSDLAPVARLAVSQRELTLLVGDIVQPIVSAIDVTGATRTDVSLAWISRGPGVAHLDAPGTVRALNPGLAVIEVSFGNVRQSIEITVVRRPVMKLQIRAVTRFLELGAALPLVADAFDDRGEAVKVVHLRWRSSAPSIVHVDSAGNTLAISEGTAHIIAEVDDISDAIELTAIESPVASVSFAMATAVLEVGEEEVLHLIVTDSSGGRRSSSGIQMWSGAPDILALDTTRMVVTALSAGIATLHASTVSADGSLGPATAASVTVQEPAVVRIITEHSALDLERGAIVSVSARAVDRRGRPVKNADIAWESATPSVVDVTRAGLICAVAAGSGTVLARVTTPGRGTIETRIAVHVQAPAVAPEPAGPVLLPPPTQIDAPARTPVPVPVAAPAPPRVSTVGNAPAHRAEAALDASTTTKAKPSAEGFATSLVEETVKPPPAPSAPAPSAPAPSAPAPSAPAALPIAAPEESSARKQSAGIAFGGGIVVVMVAAWMLLARAEHAPRHEDGGRDTSSLKRPDTARTVTGTVTPDSAQTRTPPKPDVMRRQIDSAPNRRVTDVDPRRSPEKPVADVDGKNPRTNAVVVDPPVKVPEKKAPPLQTSPTPPRPELADVKPKVMPAPLPDADAKPAGGGALESPSDADILAEAERVVSRVRTGASRPPELVGFFSDGDDQKVSLASAPASESAAQGRSRAQFTIRLTKRDFSGTSIVRIATVTIDVVKRDGNISSSTLSVGTLRKP